VKFLIIFYYNNFKKNEFVTLDTQCVQVLRRVFNLIPLHEKLILQNVNK